MKGFVLLLCGLSVLYAINENLTSDGKMKSAVRFVCGVVFLFSLAGGISTSAKGFSMPQSTANAVQPDGIYSFSCQQVVAAVLCDAKIPYGEITVFLDKTADGNINISKVTVETDYTDSETVCRVIKEKTAVPEVEVVHARLA